MREALAAVLVVVVVPAANYYFDRFVVWRCDYRTKPLARRITVVSTAFLVLVGITSIAVATNA